MWGGWTVRGRIARYKTGNRRGCTHSSLNIILLPQVGGARTFWGGFFKRWGSDALEEAGCFIRTVQTGGHLY